MTKNLILIDTSYTSFYRFFATLRWLSLAQPDLYKEHKDNKEYNWATNKIFIDKYEKMYLDSIAKLVGKKVWSNSNIIFCMDSPKITLWRQEVKCDIDYKGKRPDLSLKANFKEVFAHTYENFIPNLIKQNENIKSIQVNSMEGDDVIASICMYLKEKDKDQVIYLVSGDEDFLQLGRDNLYFVNYKKKKPFILTEEQASKALYNKIILGDISDCIPGIFKGIKIKPSDKKEILESKDKLKEYLETNKQIKLNYERNSNMIDFTNIPTKLQKQAIKKFKELF